MPTTISVFATSQSRPCQLVGAGVRRIFQLLIGVALVFPGIAGAAEPATPANSVAPASARMMAKALEFRKQAQTEAESAFVRYVGNTDKAKKLFGFLGKTLCPHTDPAKGWVYFFETSIWSLSFPTSTTAVAVFYHPWSDVALVTEWTRYTTGTTLVDADLIMGDALRNLSKPPFEIEPQWLRGPLPSHLAAGIASARTVRGGERIFAPSNKSFKDGWRNAMQLGDAGQMATNHTGVGTMFEHNLAGLTKYREDAALAPLRKQTQEMLEHIRSGRLDKVYQIAAETQPPVRAILKNHANKWGDAKVITCVTKRDEQNKEHTFVVLSLPRQPELFMSFWFRPALDATHPAALTRIDMVDQNQSYKYLGSIEKMNEAPERGTLSRATIESGNWLGRLITIGESAMQGLELSAAAGPIGNLLGGCCDELIGSTAWDLGGTRRNPAISPAREQQVPNHPPISTGAAISGPASAPSLTQPNGRPQGDGVVAPSAVANGTTNSLPPRSPQATTPGSLPPTSAQPPQGPQVSKPTGHPPSNSGTPGFTGSIPPQGPQISKPGVHPPGNPSTPGFNGNSLPPGNHPGTHPPNGNVSPSGNSCPTPSGIHQTNPPTWHPPAGSGGGGSGKPPGQI